MCKKLAIAAVVLLVAVVAVKKSSWLGTAYDKARESAKRSVPIDFQITRIKSQIQKLDQDIDKNWKPIAEEEFEVKRLKDEVAGKQKRLADMKTALLSATDELAAGVKRIKYRDVERTATDAKKLLSADAENYRVYVRELESLEKSLVARERALDAAQKRQHELRDAKHRLTARLDTIQADLRVLRLAETKTPLTIGDSSRLDDIKATLNDLEKRIAVDMRALEMQEQFNPSEPGAATTKPTGGSSPAAEDVIRKVRAAVGEDKSSVAGGSDE
jgi:chromosome segregation ATPase